MIERLLDAERNLAVGFVDRAEAIYRGLAESDPRNAVAVVGLARCALERGDEAGAYALAVRALSIDPDDAAALRLEARLSEVLAARGRPVERPAFVLPGAAPPASGAPGTPAAVPPSSSPAATGSAPASGPSSPAASGSSSPASGPSSPAASGSSSPDAGAQSGPPAADGDSGGAARPAGTPARPGLLRRILGRR